MHIALLLASLTCLPVVPADWWKPSGGENPTVRILALLAATVGLPYFLLSTTGPLLQAWYSSSHSGTSPYRLYALSNSASLLALFSYPILVEPSFGTRRQVWIWSAAYALFAGLCAWTALRDAGHRAKALPRTAAVPIEPGLKLMWVALPTCASAMMLAVTNHLCHNVAAIPFLWILPLSLYLLTFIICFEHENWYRRG